MPPILRYRHPSGVCYRHPSGVWGPPNRLDPYATVWKVTPGGRVNWARDTASATQVCVSGGAVYVVGLSNTTFAVNVWKLNASTGRTIWSQRLGAANTAAHAVCPDGAGGIIVGTGVSTYNLYRLDSAGNIVWNKLEKVGAGNISQFSRMFSNGTYVYAAHYGAGFPNNVGLSSFNVSDGTLSAHTSLATNEMLGVTVDPYVGGQLVSSRFGGSNNVMTANQSTMASIAFYTAFAFNDVDNDGTDVFGGVANSTCKLNSSYGIAWTATNKGGNAVTPYGSGGVVGAGPRVSSKSVWALNSSGSATWDWDSGSTITDVTTDGSAILACGTRTNTYATTA